MMRSLKRWSQNCVGSVRLQLAITKVVIFKLDQALESRPLSSEEIMLRGELKMKLLGIASLSSSIAHQRFRILFLREGDANSKFFHLQACY
jgi:hypothetical protein